jgi:hypothetical protein
MIPTVVQRKAICMHLYVVCNFEKNVGASAPSIGSKKYESSFQIDQYSCFDFELEFEFEIHPKVHLSKCIGIFYFCR